MKLYIILPALPRPGSMDRHAELNKNDGHSRVRRLLIRWQPGGPPLISRALFIPSLHSVESESAVGFPSRSDADIARV